MPLFLVIKNVVMRSLFKALDDYYVDNRGEVGSWVCETAMDGLERCTYILCRRDAMNFLNKSEELGQASNNAVVTSHATDTLFDIDLATNLVAGIVKQADEKMDKVREAAAEVLRRILYNNTIFVPFIPHQEKLEEIFPNELGLKWG
ncbi:hypothetical protein Nepgr_033927 [Nepenthes gracilis]|uniref:Tubulin-folding cofactor D C-terminal domain-containing protein n=1 Tax=Nepenthes gracilis TaxID=150966 RepID=A0AAD3Y7B1_NEPGR|nr:hypothetical protein Nepgr_033927 [Nepenthes gracilis]